MKYFSWKGINQQGMIQKGHCKAQNSDEVKHFLQTQNIGLISCSPTQSFIKTMRHKKIFSHKQVSTYHVASFFRSLSLLLSRGIHLIETLTILKNISTQANIPCDAIVQDLKHGASFAQALKNHISFLPNFMIPLLAAGETTGNLAMVCLQCSTYLEKQYHFSSTLRNFALLPTITFLFALTMILGISFFIVPYFETLFRSTHASHALQSFMIFKISATLHSSITWIVISAFMLGILLVYKKIMNSQTKEKMWRYLFQIPILKRLMHYRYVLTLLHIMHFFSKAGLPILNSFPYLKELSFGMPRHELDYMQKQLEQGNSLYQTCKQFDYYFPPEICALIMIGERSGMLDDALSQSIIFIEEEHNAYFKTIMTFFQPLLLCLVGGLIASFLVMLYAPIMNLASTLG